MSGSIEKGKLGRCGDAILGGVDWPAWFSSPLLLSSPLRPCTSSYTRTDSFRGVTAYLNRTKKKQIISYEPATANMGGCGKSLATKATKDAAPVSIRWSVS